MKIDEVTKEDVSRIANQVRSHRLDNQLHSNREYEDPYPCNEHRHFRCKDCHTVVCGREFDIDPFKSEGEHERLCHNCNESIKEFERHTPFWVRDYE